MPPLFRHQSLAGSRAFLVVGIPALFLACSSDRVEGEPMDGLGATSSALGSVPTNIHVPSQPMGVIHHAVGADASSVNIETTPLPAGAYGFDPAPAAKTGAPSAPTALTRLHPELETRVAAAELAGTLQTPIDVVVTFRENLQIPRFPDPIETEARTSPRNVAAQAQATQLVNDVVAARAPGYARLGQELATAHGATVRQTFWLIHGMTIRVPIGQVRGLVARADVQYVEENQTNIPPPANESVDARAVMSTDPYFNLNLTGGYIGLLDTGLRTTHTLITNYSYLRDCVNGGSDCNTGTNLNTDDDAWNHGTSSVSELTANANLGNANRGVTGINVDSFKIYNSAGLVRDAAVNGFQAAIPALDRVIVAEIQDDDTENGAIATAADAAYAAGAVVVAAAGNFGHDNTPSTVRSPGKARKALGVGAADVTSLAVQDYSGQGPTADGRTKPDILGPTHVYAASTASNTALQLFTGTSAATPNAAGATALLRNFLRGSNFNVDPGQINAFMILNAANWTNPANDNTSGSGMVSLAGPSGHRWWGAVNVPVSGNTIPRPAVEVPFDVDRGPLDPTFGIIAAAIWWPDAIGAPHRDIDLCLVDPTDSVRGCSTSYGSVWEKVAMPFGYVPTGTWKLRISSYTVETPIPVYFAIRK